jgi:hypothetical protein
MNCKKLLIAACGLLWLGTAVAQKNRPKFKFGDVKPEDFAPTAYTVDSTAEAVYLFETGSSSFVGNNNGFFSVVFKEHVRIRLLNKNAFDLATVEINLYGKNEDAQKLSNLEVCTYNLESGKVVATKLDKSSLFKDKADGVNTSRFTFPAIKEGSIIEYSYQVTSPGIDFIRPWYYQGNYPRLWSEYEVTIPVLFDFVFVKQGYHPYAIDTAKVSFGSLYLTDPGSAGQASQTYSWSGNTVNSIWAMKDVPALKKEAYTTTIGNHVAKIEFQLSAVRYPNQPVKRYLSNWEEAAAARLKNENFGQGLSERNGWMADELKLITDNKAGLEAVKKVYYHVRDNYSCDNEETTWLSQASLKKVYQSKKGNVADINLLLTAMYRNLGYEAEPVILSTRDHGKVLETYPIMTKFNYVLCRVRLDDNYYLLDATQPDMGFGKIPVKCYNGSGRIIGDKPFLVQLASDSLKESSLTSVFLVNSDNGITGTVTSNEGYFASAGIRSKLRKVKEEDFFKEIKKSFNWEVELANSGVDSLKILEEPVSYHYDLNFSLNDDGLVYFTPIIGSALYKENPFRAAERFYPVEMPYCLDETYVLNMEVPKGYKVEELPKSTRVNLNETEGRYEYIVAASADRIQLRSRLVLNRATFMPDDYQTLRDFYTYVVKKQSEKIVFKKIN